VSQKEFMGSVFDRIYRIGGFGVCKCVVIASDPNYVGAWRSQPHETASVAKHLAWTGGLDHPGLPRHSRPDSMLLAMTSAGCRAVKN